MSATSAGRFADRARRRRRLSLRPVLAATGVLALAGGIAWLLLWSTVLDVRAVDVAGARRLAEQRVLEVASVVDGRPLARVDTAAVAARVAALAPVADVQVRRNWPHKVEIVVTERDPVAVVRVADGFTLVDGSGVLFGHEPKRPARLPLLRVDLSEKDLRVREAAAGVVAELPAELFRQVETVTAGSIDDIRLRLRSGQTVVWGGPGRSARKAAVLQVLMNPRSPQPPAAPTADGGDGAAAAADADGAGDAAGAAAADGRGDDGNREALDALEALEDVEVYDVSAPDVPTTR